MEFYDKLTLLLIDKVIIAGIAFYLWHLYSKNKETHKEEAEKRRLLEVQIEGLKIEKEKTELNEKIILLEQQVEKFFWPISLCMKNDDAVWQRVPSLYDDGNQLPTDAGQIVEREFLIPNHEKAVNIIEDNFHLIGENDDLIKELVKYIRHVAVFKSLRLSGATMNPIDVNEPFPQNLIEIVENETENRIKELEKLRASRWNINAAR